MNLFVSLWLEWVAATITANIDLAEYLWDLP